MRNNVSTGEYSRNVSASCSHCGWRIAPYVDDFETRCLVCIGLGEPPHPDNDIEPEAELEME